MIKGKSKASSTERARLPHNMCAIAHHELAKKARDFVKTITGTLLKMEKSAHTALAVKACLLGGKTATLNAQ